MLVLATHYHGKANLALFSIIFLHCILVISFYVEPSRRHVVKCSVMNLISDTIQSMPNGNSEISYSVQTVPLYPRTHITVFSISAKITHCIHSVRLCHSSLLMYIKSFSLTLFCQYFYFKIDITCCSSKSVEPVCC